MAPQQTCQERAAHQTHRPGNRGNKETKDNPEGDAKLHSVDWSIYRTTLSQTLQSWALQKWPEKNQLLKEKNKQKRLFVKRHV
jgi:hypothetical protein